MTLRDIEAMPSSEYTEWIEYHDKIPFRAERMDCLLATLLALTCNINRAENHAIYEVVDFLPWLKDGPVKYTETAVKTTMQTARETDSINRRMLNFRDKLATIPQVLNGT